MLVVSQYKCELSQSRTLEQLTVKYLTDVKGNFWETFNFGENMSISITLVFFFKFLINCCTRLVLFSSCLVNNLRFHDVHIRFPLLNHSASVGCFKTNDCKSL